MTEERTPIVFLDRTEEYALGENETDHYIYTPDETREATIALTEQAKRLVQIFTRELDADVYDNQRFVDAVSALARRSPSSEVQILVQDPRLAVKTNHALVPLCQQLTSYVRVRRVHDDYLLTPDEFLIADKMGFVYRKSYREYEGVVNFASSSKAHRLDEVFNEIWNVSTAEPEFRHLHI